MDKLHRPVFICWEHCSILFLATLLANFPGPAPIDAIATLANGHDNPEGMYAALSRVQQTMNLYRGYEVICVDLINFYTKYLTQPDKSLNLTQVELESWYHNTRDRITRLLVGGNPLFGGEL